MNSVATVGNATMICYEGSKPILSTDPWFGEKDPAYFGSWIGSHTIPKNYQDDILKSEFIWLSHGHPDHLNPQSIKNFLHKKILISDHYGSRIFNEIFS